MCLRLFTGVLKTYWKHTGKWCLPGVKLTQTALWGASPKGDIEQLHAAGGKGCRAEAPSLTIELREKDSQFVPRMMVPAAAHLTSS